MRKQALGMVMALCACGPTFTGKVSGYSLELNDALFTTLTDSKGADSA